MNTKPYLLIPLESRGYPIGVEAEVAGEGTEIHGTFASIEEAAEYADALAKGDLIPPNRHRERGRNRKQYASVKVVTIETPGVGRVPR